MEIQFVDNFRKTKNEKIKKIFFCFLHRYFTDIWRY